MLLDKTGTLTCGKPQVSAVEPAPGSSEREVLGAAAVAERNSEHPLALAILAAAHERRITVGEPLSFNYEPGKSVRAVVSGDSILAGNSSFLENEGVAVPRLCETAGTRVLVARNGAFLGSVQIADQVRGEAGQAITDLRRIGLEVELVTVDKAASAQAVPEAIGVTHVLSGLLPNQKLARVVELMRSGRVVTIIGDRINDPPALAHAHVGVAMGSGTEVAHASANVLLIGNDLRKFAETVKTARWRERSYSRIFTARSPWMPLELCWQDGNHQPARHGVRSRALRTGLHSEFHAHAAASLAAETVVRGEAAQAA